jgi:hypothetical protein
MKNYPKPLLIDMMKSLYYVYESGFLEYEMMLGVLATQYEVYDIEITDNKFTCSQIGSKSTINI